MIDIVMYGVMSYQEVVMAAIEKSRST